MSGVRHGRTGRRAHRRAAAEDGGQATVEFLVVSVGLLAIALGLAAIAGYLCEGALVDEASRHAANAVEAVGQTARRVLIY